MVKSVAVIDYGSGNVHSMCQSLDVAGAGGAKITLTNDLEVIANADYMVLPGVGAFADCKAGLQASDGIVDTIKEHALIKKKPFLGVCVGMQLLAKEGKEGGNFPGLAWFDATVEALSPRKKLPIPHMGWNSLSFKQNHPITQNVEQGAHVYFVHSFAMTCSDKNDVVATTNYEQEITAIIAKDNVVATQFHPEKSQQTGLKILANFLNT